LGVVVVLQTEDFSRLGKPTKEGPMTTCTHIDQIRDVSPAANGCVECLKTGDTWVHLRMCVSCGHIGCCDSSKNKHASQHARNEAHPVVQSFEPGEDWYWCYVDEVAFIVEDAPTFSYAPGRPTRSGGVI
jgi:uncharacterized UBP type Zn finger protein